MTTKFLKDLGLEGLVNFSSATLTIFSVDFIYLTAKKFPVPGNTMSASKVFVLAKE
jgi:hypothetical protein